MLHGKKALITGSSRGIGLGVAEAFIRNGAAVVLSSERPIADCPEAADVIRKPGACYVQADMTQPGEPERLVDEAWQRLDGLDVLVNNVGTFREPTFGEITRANFDFIFG